MASLRHPWKVLDVYLENHPTNPKYHKVRIFRIDGLKKPNNMSYTNRFLNKNLGFKKVASSKVDTSHVSSVTNLFLFTIVHHFSSI